MAYVLIILTALFSILDLDELKKKNPRNSKSWVQLIILLTASGVMLYLEWDKSIKEAKAIANAKTQDSLKDVTAFRRIQESNTLIIDGIGQAIGKYSLGYDSAKKEIMNLKDMVGSIDKSNLKPADVELLPEPHNVLNYSCDDTTDVTASVQITNLGEQVAYGLTYDIFYIVKIDGKFYKLSSHKNVINNTLSPNVNKQIANTISLALDNKRVSICNRIEELFCFIIGKYYLDEKHTIKKSILFGISKEKNAQVSSIWDYNKSIPKFINDALGKFVQ